MRKVLLLTIFLGCSSVPVFAQDFSRFETFGGYQYTRLSTTISPVQSANGWDGAFTVKLTKQFGITGDFTGAYQTVSGSYINVSGTFPGHYYTFAGGPMVSFPSKSRLTPFAHALFGGIRVSSSASADGVTVGASKTGFTTMLGGGLDVRLNPHISIRAVQFDWMYDLFSGVGPLGITSTAGNFKIATGVVFAFSGK